MGRSVLRRRGLAGISNELGRFRSFTKYSSYGRLHHQHWPTLCFFFTSTVNTTVNAQVKSQPLVWNLSQNLSQFCHNLVNSMINQYFSDNWREIWQFEAFRPHNGNWSRISVGTDRPFYVNSHDNYLQNSQQWNLPTSVSADSKGVARIISPGFTGWYDQSGIVLRYEERIIWIIYILSPTPFVSFPPLVFEPPKMKIFRF